MSLIAEPETEHHERATRGINLVALARPYFGLIVLTTSLLTAFGIVAMLRMPSGIYPEVAFPRIVVIAQTPGLGVKDVEVAVTRPIEEVVGIVLGVVRVRSKSVRGAAELSIDFAPGTDMIQAHGRGGRPAPGGYVNDHRAADSVGFSHHLIRCHRRARPVSAPRLRLL
jgi:AcrB/AcrD/AcrF family